MPIDVRRFGVGHRRKDGPAGTVGIESQVIHSDELGTISELAFGRTARLETHASPHATHFVVIEGGGWVGVGDEAIRVAAGDAAVLPPDIPHAAWTEYTPMRAILIEFIGAVHAPLTLEGRARALDAGSSGGITRGEGALADRDKGGPSDPWSGEPQ